jgi:hypothetical protein
MSEPESFPINSVARNSVWIYDAFSTPRFDSAPTIVERTRSHRMPDFSKLPESADIAVELYSGAVTLRLDGATRRVYTGRFDYATYRTDEESRHAFLTLWREVERLQASDAVERARQNGLDTSARDGTYTCPSSGRRNRHRLPTLAAQ